jgi:hypothetical protein
MKTGGGSTVFSIQQYVSLIALSSVATILFGIKLLVIGTYGNATPYWDQWDSETQLYGAFLGHQLGWDNLFTAHNEHRILCPRLLALSLLYGNGIWNPLLQMVVNAALHVGFIGFYAWLLLKVVGERFVWPIAGFSLVLGAVPYGWENTLAGFQSCFYLFLPASVGAIWLVSRADPFSLRWWGGVGLACGAFFCAASGGLVLAAVAAVGVLQRWLGIRTSRRELASFMALGVLFVVSVVCTPRIERHNTLQATTLLQFLDSFDGYSAWPIKATILGSLLRNAPAVFFSIWILRTKPAVNDRRWFLFTLAVWSVGQSMTMAHSRAVGFVPSRYMDMLAVDVLANFACLLCLAQAECPRTRWAMAAATAWVGIVLGSLGVSAHKRCPGELEHRRATALAQEVNTKNYVYTGDVSHLTDKPHLHVPYPWPEKLAAILDRPVVRAILPRNIGAPMAGTIAGRAPGDAGILAGHGPEVPAPLTPAWGTFDVAEMPQNTTFAVMFPEAHRGYCVEIPIAGKHDAPGISIEIEQNGMRRPLHAVGHGTDGWRIAIAKVRGSPFTVHVVDTNPDAWVAVGSPVAVGRWDDRVDRLLSRWYVFVVIGAVVAVAGATLASLALAEPGSYSPSV